MKNASCLGFTHYTNAAVTLEKAGRRLPRKKGTLKSAKKCSWCRPQSATRTFVWNYPGEMAGPAKLKAYIARPNISLFMNSKNIVLQDEDKRVSLTKHCSCHGSRNSWFAIQELPRTFPVFDEQCPFARFLHRMELGSCSELSISRPKHFTIFEPPNPSIDGSLEHKVCNRQISKA